MNVFLCLTIPIVFFTIVSSHEHEHKPVRASRTTLKAAIFSDVTKSSLSKSLRSAPFSASKTGAFHGPWINPAKFPFLVTADRRAGTITVIDSRRVNASTTISLGTGAEPMYIASDVRNRQIWVADRSTSRLIRFIYTHNGFVRAGSVSTANGTFHTMSTQDDRTFFPLAWTSCDTDRVTVVHSMVNGKRLATIPTPPFIDKLGGFPHDIAVAFRFGVVTYIGASSGKGYVAIYNAFNFQRITVRALVQDPHVAIRGNSDLFVAAQGGDLSQGRVYKLSVPDLNILATDRQPSPHGICISFDERVLYVTNIAENGDNAIVVYRTSDLKRIDCGNISTPFAVPHNVAQSFDMSKLFVTHSLPDIGATSVFKLDHRGCPIQSSLEIESTGLLAFGITPFSPQLKIWRYFN